MRHRQSGRRFDMPTGQRNHMFRILVRTVITRGGAFTTEARAKEVRRIIDRMITLGKKRYCACTATCAFVHSR